MMYPCFAWTPSCGLRRSLTPWCFVADCLLETKRLYRVSLFVNQVRAHKAGTTSICREVGNLSRIGFCVNLHFAARGDGTAGQLAEPRLARLKAAAEALCAADDEARDRGGDGKAGKLDGVLGFRLDRRGAAKTAGPRKLEALGFAVCLNYDVKTQGEYILEYGEPEEYQPALKLRSAADTDDSHCKCALQTSLVCTVGSRMGQKPTPFQAQVGRFLGGYLTK
eukprot:4813162-Amphidinium_carterae.1